MVAWHIEIMDSVTLYQIANLIGLGMVEIIAVGIQDLYYFRRQKME